MKINRINCLIVLAGMLPLLSKVPYIYQAWCNSPLERWNVIFAGLALMMAAAGSWRWRKPERRDWRFLVGIYLAGLILPIHAVAAVGGILCLWSCAGVVGGRGVAKLLMPSSCVLFFAVPSTGYWIGYFTEMDGLMLKIIGTVLMAVWQVRMIFYFGKFRLIHLIFFIASGILAILYFLPGRNREAFPAFRPEWSELQFGQFVGREEPASAGDLRFFGKSRVYRAYLAGDDGRFVNLLVVDNFEDVHKIHPAGYCLKAAGFDVVSEQTRRMEFAGKPFQVSETVAEQGGRGMLIWSWYSDANVSTGSFLFFRRNCTDERGWQACQVATSLEGGLENARETLRAFLNSAARR